MRGQFFIQRPGDIIYTHLVENYYNLSVDIEEGVV